MPDQFLDQLPIWLHALIVMAILCLGIIIRRRPSRHYEFGKGVFRFRLRTLLIATTLTAVVLGLIVWMARK